MHPVVTLSPVASLAERQIDEMLANSFPASDPPSWTLTGAETSPVERSATTDPAVSAWRALSAGRYFRAMAAVLGAAGLALMVPLFVIVLPLAIVYRLVLEVTGWPDWLRRA